jgi:hypothetical protein
MADEFAVPEPSDQPDPAQAVKDAALTQMARREDAGDYIAERQAREAEAKGEQVNGEDRTARIREALTKAREETQQARQQNGLDQPPPDLDAQLQDAEAQWAAEQEQEQTFEQEREFARAEGKFMATAENLKAVNPQAWQEITDSLGVLDSMIVPEQASALRKALVRGDPREGLAVVHRLTKPSYRPDRSIEMTPQDKIAYLASLPPEQMSELVNQARYYLQIEHQVSNHYRRAYEAQGRRHTKAPPVFKAPRGGASPPQNLNALASKSENPADYIKTRALRH